MFRVQEMRGWKGAGFSGDGDQVSWCVLLQVAAHQQHRPCTAAAVVCECAAEGRGRRGEGEIVATFLKRLQHCRVFADLDGEVQHLGCCETKR